MSNFSCIGLVSKDQDEFAGLLDRLIEMAADDMPAPAPMRHLRWTDRSGASVAFHLSDAHTIDCVTPFFAASKPATWRVRTTAASDDADCRHCGGADCDVLDERGEMVTRATVQWLHFEPWRKWLCKPREFVLQVVAFASRVAFYPSKEGFYSGQQSWWPGGASESGSEGKSIRFAEQSFLPEGMFGSEHDLRIRATCMFAGRLESAFLLTNAVSGKTFLHSRIATLHGTVDVVSDRHEGTPESGSLAVVRAWLVGRPESRGPADSDREPARGWWSRTFRR